MEKIYLPHHEMILIEGGTFQMGSENEEAYDDEKPIHKVSISTFYIAKYPVTQALWEAVMGVGTNPSYFKGPQRPVEWVSWEDAQQFIEILNEKTGQEYRLPREAEWEYAARGGAKGKDYLYAGSNKLKEVGWYWENSHGETKAVGQKRPNELGLYDMSGNVWEWCLDLYDSYYYEKCGEEPIVKDPRGSQKGTDRVLRGGSWFYYSRECRCTCRRSYWPVFHYEDVGFRLVISPSSIG